MKHKNMAHALYFACSLLALAGAALLSLTTGEVDIPLSNLGKVLTNDGSMAHSILTHIRIPRTILALSIGGSLSLSGVILQGIYRNPLVEPYTLGISGGASLGVTLAIVTGAYFLGRFTLPFFGFAGAFATIFLVYILSLRRGQVSVNRMLLIGVMISFISSAMVMFLMSITSIEHIPGIVFWTMGALNESDPLIVGGMLTVAIALLFISFFFAIPLNALRTGESKARHLGINTSLIIRLLFVLTSLLTGCCIAVAGVIGFVGLTIPHITRYFIGTDFRFLLPASFINGGIFLICCDVVSRTLIAPNELPIGVITGIVGGVTFIFIIASPRLNSKTSES